MSWKENSRNILNTFFFFTTGDTEITRKWAGSDAEVQGPEENVDERMGGGGGGVKIWGFKAPKKCQKPPAKKTKNIA